MENHPALSNSTTKQGRETVDLANKEYKNWKNIYGNPGYGPPMCRQLKLLEGRCLVMPYLKPIPESRRVDLLKKRRGEGESIKETLRNFAKSGYKHEDVKWRHFGLWKDKIFLLDLGKVAKVEKNDIDSWVDETLEKLRKKAGKPETQVTPTNKRKQKASVSVRRTKKRKKGKKGTGSPLEPKIDY